MVGPSSFMAPTLINYGAKKLQTAVMLLSLMSIFFLFISFLHITQALLVTYPTQRGFKEITFHYFMMGLGARGTIPHSFQSVGEIDAEIYAWRHRLTKQEENLFSLENQSVTQWRPNNVHCFNLSQIGEKDIYLLLNNLWAFDCFSRRQLSDIYYRMIMFNFYKFKHKFGHEIQQVMDAIRQPNRPSRLAATSKRKPKKSKVLGAIQEEEEEYEDKQGKEEVKLDKRIIDALYESNGVGVGRGNKKKDTSVKEYLVNSFCRSFGIRREKQFATNASFAVLRIPMLVNSLKKDSLLLFDYLMNVDHGSGKDMKLLLLKASNDMMECLKKYPLPGDQHKRKHKQ